MRGARSLRVLRRPEAPVMFELTDTTRAVVIIAAWLVGQVALFVYIYRGCGGGRKET